MRSVKRIGALVLAAACLGQEPAAGPAPAAGLDHGRQVMLIKNALTAVNQANLTGNYTVLRDLGTPRFRQQHNAADLAITYTSLRQQKVDLSPILVREPQFAQPPVEDPPGRLLLAGSFPTRPLAIHFGVVFQRVEGCWMIDDVAVSVSATAAPGQPSDSRAAK